MAASTATTAGTEFVLYEDPDKSFSINTSLQAETRWLIPDICEALGLVAFDKQTYTLIGR